MEALLSRKWIKGSYVVIWDRNDYLSKAEKQLKDKNVFTDTKFHNNILTDLTKKTQ